MDDFTKYLEEKLADPEFKKEWDASEPEYSLMDAIVSARKSQHLTQKQLAERTGIDQSDISKIENGIANPALSTLKRLADGMDMILKLEFIPRHPA